MNGKTIALCAVMLVGITVLMSRQAVSQEAGQANMQQPGAEQMQEMMAKWMATIEPGEHHKKLDQFVGEWDTVAKIWWGGPGSPPNETKGTSKNKWVLGGRYIMHEFKGTFMMPDASGDTKPMPWEGLGLIGYDNYRNMYVGTWSSNMDTMLLTFKGSSDPAGTVFTYYGEMDEPMLNVTGRMIKYVTRVIDKNKHVFTIYDLHAGDDYKVIEITYTRKE
ncbi:MAG: DUF1579 domain-containing protein [Planctomycetes bacterium]|nr:DUF1579 domain-containing protein [Planctomycetota bacterium]